MSGGHFDYKQYSIGDIADSIVMEIARAKRPLPPPTTRKGVINKVKNGENSFSYDGRYCNYFNSFDEAKEFFQRLDVMKILSERTLPNGERELTILDERINETRIFTFYTEEVYLNDDGEEIYQPEYSEETINEFKNAIRNLRMAQVYAQRVDWLISGDDGEDSFHRRLAEDLTNITMEQIEQEILEEINKLTNN